MAKVAVPGSLSSNSLPFSGCASKVQSDAAMKRKTPSELRGEQLKRSYVELVDKSLDPLLDSDKNTTGKGRGLKKPESLKNPRYIDTRVNEVYPARKFSVRMIHGKEKARDNFSIEQTNSLKNSSLTSNLASKSQPQLSRPEHSAASAASAKDSMAQAYQTTEHCTENTFRSVAELSLGSERLSGLSTDKALKGLVARDQPAISHTPADSSERYGDFPSTHSGNFNSEFHIPGQKSPLDFTLKTNMRLVSSSSVNWCHRLITSGTYHNMVQFTSQSCCSADHNVSNSLGPTSKAEVLFSKALHSWVYPQSSLPHSVISALTLSAAQGETDFLLKRHLAWEDSFRSLYYMLRNNKCNSFYVCTSQFVVMFTGGDCSRRTKRSCNAYVSQSTRGLRSLLREHDVCFSMPLCHSKVEHATAEDLVELSEIEKHNLGQTRRLGSISDVDNGPQSLLAFSGNENVHGLYDFLLNYRSFLRSLAGMDVPLLYSPLPFQNAALCAPEVRCKEMKRAESVAFPLRGPHIEDGESNQDSQAGVCYSIEIKDTFLPPWIICGVCAAMSSEGRNFEASFTTEPISLGLNVALETSCQKSDPQTDTGKGLPESSYAFGVPEAVVSPCLLSASLRGLKYFNGSYTASLSRV
ncbi:hypothetical protein HHK36_011520 [Tetracentron sinense]|uniref:Protein downstream neighbor of Son n=1 Tax=Tetracentron sinense TaxID=13715 RepID=A0A834ZIS0_TETSI|nr:hypothetical protein HHK36_011520 [Tetracentron sinense]